MTSDNHELLLGSPGWYTGVWCARPRPVWMQMHITHCEGWKRAPTRKKNNGIRMTNENTRDGGCILPPLFLGGVQSHAWWIVWHKLHWHAKTHARHQTQGPQLSGRRTRRIQIWRNIQDTRNKKKHIVFILYTFEASFCICLYMCLQAST